MKQDNPNEVGRETRVNLGMREDGACDQNPLRNSWITTKGEINFCVCNGHNIDFFLILIAALWYKRKCFYNQFHYTIHLSYLKEIYQLLNSKVFLMRYFKYLNTFKGYLLVYVSVCERNSCLMTESS